MVIPVKLRTIVSNLAFVGTIFVIVIIWVFPIAWTFLTSIKSDVDAWSLPPRWVFSPTSTNYYTVLKEKNVLSFLRNSTIVAVGSTVVALVSGVPAAWIFARFRFRFGGILLFSILMAYILPGSVVCLPLYSAAARIGALNKYWILIASHGLFNLAFTVWMMTSFFAGLPRELEESALVDGCDYVGALVRIALPLAAPGIAVTTIFCFMLSWNDFMYSLVLSSFETRTIPVGLTQFLTPHGLIWGELCATAILALAIPVLLAAVMQSHIVEGLTLGAIK